MVIVCENCPHHLRVCLPSSVQPRAAQMEVMTPATTEKRRRRETDLAFK